MNREACATLGFQKELSASSADKLNLLATIVATPENQVLFREGERHPNIYWLRTGRVRLEMSGIGGGSKAILTTGVGDLLAWSSLLGDERMTATATTNEPTTLISFNAAELLKLCEANHDIGYRVMHNVAKLVSNRLVATRLQLLDLFQHPTDKNE